MNNKLKQYFPMIRSRQEVMNEIERKPGLYSMFYSWSEEQRKEFLDFCSGVRGIKIMYDFMIKEILNPESTPERVNELLSLLLKQKVRIVETLPNDGTRLADETTLLITDMVVQLEDGSIANLEIQKVGYYFPGERSACYSADLLLRQYKRVRGEKGQNFSYKDIQPVYTIVLFEKSPSEFNKIQDKYVHRFSQKSDTGAFVNLLQEYVFVTLDIFNEIKQNKNGSINIENRLDAWLALFSTDDPDIIVEIITKYPDFKEIYEQVYDVCRNIEEVMQMFSKELQILDRNTVRLMIDDMQKDIDQKKDQLRQMNEQLESMDGQLEEKKEQLEEKTEQLEEKTEQLEEKKEQLEKKNKQLEEKDEEIRRLREELKKVHN